MNILFSTNQRENEYLTAANNYLKAKKFSQSSDLASKLIAKNASLSGAYWIRLLANLEAVDGEAFMTFFNQDELNEKVLAKQDFKNAMACGSPEQKAYYQGFIDRLRKKWKDIQDHKSQYEDAYYHYLKKEFVKFPYNKRRRFYYRAIDPMANDILNNYAIIYYILGAFASYFTFYAISLVAGEGAIGWWFFLTPVFYYIVKFLVILITAIVFFPIKIVKKKTAKIKSYEEFVHDVSYVKTSFNFELTKLDRAVKFYLNREQVQAGDVL